MNNPLDPLLRELDPAGCFAGRTSATPAPIDNRPGLDAIAFRVGTHPQFKASLLAGLSNSTWLAERLRAARLATPDPKPSLPTGLRSRDDNDLTIALLDGWAAVADILSFYSERIANETYLRTATERRSVLELARAIGYELKPGKAAAWWLAFTVEDAPGAPGFSNVPAGTKVQSIPGPDEKPQVYQTTEALLARQEWNELHPVRAGLPSPYHGQESIRLLGTATSLKPGDTLVILGDERKGNSGSEQWDFRRVAKLETFGTETPPYTQVTFDRPLGKATPPFTLPAKKNARVFALRHRAGFFGAGAPDWGSLPDTTKLRFLNLAGVLTPDTSSHGLLGMYFSDSGFGTYVLSRIDSQIAKDWTGTSPGSGVGSEHYSVRWLGFIKPQATGSHRFEIKSDDGARLWLDGEKLIDTWAWTADQETVQSPARYLDASTAHSLVLEYRQITGPAYISLSWIDPTGAKSLVPTAALFPLRGPVSFPADWPGFTIHEISPEQHDGLPTIHLDAVHPTIAVGSWMVLARPAYEELYQVADVTEEAKAGFTLTAKTTRLVIRGENLREKFDASVRDTTVFAQSEELPRVPEPVLARIEGDRIDLDSAVPALPSGRRILVRGTAAHVQVLRGDETLPTFVPDEGTARPLNADEILRLLGGPVPELQNPGKSRWRVETAQKIVGTVTAATAAFKSVAAPEGASTVAEIAVVKESIETATGATALLLQEPLQFSYDQATVSILGNVAYSTHGETVTETLGHGDSSQAFQRFTLKQQPLTQVPDSSIAGVASTLQLWVNDVRWHETPTLFDRGPAERVFISRLADDGTVTIETGDGRTGARLPTGTENVRAIYRKGTGTVGTVKTGQLSLLLTKPLGTRAVTNALPSSAPADPQQLADARRNAPRTTLTLDRIVSLRDYEDFARDFPGVAKAHAAWMWCEHTRGVLLSVLGPDGIAIAETSDTAQQLLAAFRAGGNSLVPMRIVSAPAVRFSLGAFLTVTADHDPTIVLAAARGALATRFSFVAGEYGVSVARSQVIALLQAIPGVDAIELTSLVRPDPPTGQPGDLLLARVPADGIAASHAFAAELLVLDAESLAAVEVKTP